MVNAVSSSQNDYYLTATGAKKSENTGNGESERSNEENLGYNLSLSEEGWNSLGKKEEEDKNGKELSEEDQRRVEELKKIDKKVHAHEQAHLSAAGGYARGGANYDYVTGPDGNRYANSGHVNLDTGKEKTPEATIRKANIIQKAALAPADPSPADKEIAANAAKMAEEAREELSQKKMLGTKNAQAPAQAPQNDENETQAPTSKAT